MDMSRMATGRHDDDTNVTLGDDREVPFANLDYYCRSLCFGF